MPSDQDEWRGVKHADSLIHLFDDVARRQPKATSVSDGSRELTYDQLLSMSTLLAARFKDDYGLAAGDRAAVQIAPSIEAVVTVLAILRCGASYVPLDKTSPAARNRAIISDCAPKIVISEDVIDTDAGQLFVDPVPIEELSVASLGDATPTPPVCVSEDICYTIYTSGTTGTPKGLPITHRNVTALFAATGELFTFGTSDVWTLYHSISFDYSVWELWGALLSGGKLVIVDAWEKFTPERMTRKIVDHGVTVLNVTPTEFGFLCDSLLEQVADRSTTTLRYIVFGGERLRSSHIRRWLNKVGGIKPELINMYGLTEATVHATYYKVKPDDGRLTDIPVGLPLPGFEYMVLDSDGQPASEGELLLAGPQVASGYLNRPELTRERFRAEIGPVDGEEPRVFYRTGDLVRSDLEGLIHLGRNDEQVKLRGYRIELGEVADAASRLPNVGQVCVIADYGPSTEPRLLCAYTTERGGPLEAPLLRRLLRTKIPHYMVPEVFHHFTEFPITVNGKTDTERIKYDMELAK